MVVAKVRLELVLQYSVLAVALVPSIARCTIQMTAHLLCFQSKLGVGTQTLLLKLK